MGIIRAALATTQVLVRSTVMQLAMIPVPTECALAVNDQSCKHRFWLWVPVPGNQSQLKRRGLVWGGCGWRRKGQGLCAERPSSFQGLTWSFILLLWKCSKHPEPLGEKHNGYWPTYLMDISIDILPCLFYLLKNACKCTFKLQISLFPP